MGDNRLERWNVPRVQKARVRVMKLFRYKLVCLNISFIIPIKHSLRQIGLETQITRGNIIEGALS